MQIRDKNLYYVGGVVRDEILGLPSFDIDFCYEGNALEFAKKYNIIRENPDFGTVRILSDNKEEIDIASTRIETYPKLGHLPFVNKIGCSLKEDLKRRDFTINAMAKNTLTGDVIDYFGGKQDIEKKKIRVLHENSFLEDPSRIVRGLKFSVRFSFELEENTKKLQDAYLDNINYDMSYHRLKKELKETFNLNIEEAFSRFIEQKIYKLLGESVQPVGFLTSAQKLVEDFKPTHTWLVYLGLLDLSKLDLTAEEQNIIDSFNNIKCFKPQKDIEIYNLFINVPLESVLLYALGVDCDIALKFLNKLLNVRIETTGKDLISLGFVQGKIFKDIFECLIEQKIISPEMSKEDEIALVKKRFL